MSGNPADLTLEQLLSSRLFEDQVKQMSREQAQEMLVKLHQQLLTQGNIANHLIAKKWGIK